MNSLHKAYLIGKQLYLSKVAAELDSEKNLTNVLKALVSNTPEEDSEEVDEVLGGEERKSKATWGDKINLEPSSAQGIEV